MKTTEAITASGLSVRMGNRNVLHDVSFSFVAGRVIGIAGPNGSGKTTLLNVLSAGIQNVSGSVLLYGQDIRTMNYRQIAQRVAVVPQFEDIPDRFRVKESVLLGRAPHLQDFQGYTAQDYTLVDEALAQVGLYDCADREVSSLSGGERQRVLIARAITQGCDCMLLDEPTNHLDVRYQHQLLQLITNVASTVVVVLHDLNLVARYCDEVLVLNDGRIAVAGKPSEVLNSHAIESIYGINVHQVWDGKCQQFIFSP